MNKRTLDYLSEEHLMLFGAIIQWFARHEILMHEIMGAVSGSDATSMKLLTNGLSFTVKRDALFNLLRHRAVPLDRVDQVRRHLEILHTFTPLRDDILHSAWVGGKSANSIRPAWLSHGAVAAIKPVHDIGEHSKAFIEDYNDDVTYTLNDLKDIADNLEVNYARFREYVREIWPVSGSEDT
jgi:hypothetical protein